MCSPDSGHAHPPDSAGPADLCKRYAWPEVVTIDDVRCVTASLPRSYEVVVRGRVKFRVGRIVYLDFSRDESIMGFAFPREWRPVLVSSDPAKFMLPIESELRWNWVRVRLAAIDIPEMRELVVDAWSMVVPKGVAAAYAGVKLSAGTDCTAGRP
jgi:hypothetical protein